MTNNIDTLPTLPDEITARPVSPDDIPAIVAVVMAYEIEQVGQASMVPGDLLELWDDEGVELADDTRVLVTREGEIIAYTCVTPGLMLDPHTHVHPRYQHLGLEHYLLQFAEQRAQQHADPTLPQLIYGYSFYPAWTEVLKREGYSVKSSDWRMEITLDEAPPVPQPLPGITVRPYIPGQEEHAIHFVVQEAFADIGGRPYRPFEEWEEGNLKRASFEPALLYVALDGDRIVGVTICRVYPDQHTGHIGQVAVARSYRKRGIGLHLLQTVFGAYYRRGITHITLDVDTQNATGAHQLYQRAGMRQSEQIDEIQKAL